MRSYPAAFYCTLSLPKVRNFLLAAICTYTGEGVIKVDDDNNNDVGGPLYCRPNLKVTRVLTSGALANEDGEVFECDVVDADTVTQVSTTALNPERTYVLVGRSRFHDPSRTLHSPAVA